MNYRSIVLLSGGLDSVAALHWSLERYPTEALSFHYGQPNRDAETAAAGVIAKRRGVHLETFALCDAIHGGRGLRVAEPGVDAAGVSRSNMAGRNMSFLSIAAAHGARRHPGARLRLVIGCNADDAERFPDCRADFLGAASAVLALALRGIVEDVSVEAPWARLRKGAIVRQAKPAALEDIATSVSCYAGTACGTCDACTLRARAFADAGQAALRPRSVP